MLASEKILHHAVILEIFGYEQQRDLFTTKTRRQLNHTVNFEVKPELVLDQIFTWIQIPTSVKQKHSAVVKHVSTKYSTCSQKRILGLLQTWLLHKIQLSLLVFTDARFDKTGYAEQVTNIPAQKHDFAFLVHMNRTILQ